MTRHVALESIFSASVMARHCTIAEVVLWGSADPLLGIWG